MTSQKERLYGSLSQDGDSEDADNVYPGTHGRSFLLRSLLVLNTILALVVVGLVARILSQFHETTPTHYDGVGSVQLLDDQRGFTSKVIKTYRFFEENLDDYDFGKGDPYWAALFPCKSGARTKSPGRVLTVNAAGGGQLLLDDDVVASYKLPNSLRVPEKGNHSAYMMAGYHSLHCLVSLYFSLLSVSCCKLTRASRP